MDAESNIEYSDDLNTALARNKMNELKWYNEKIHPNKYCNRVSTDNTHHHIVKRKLDLSGPTQSVRDE